MNPQETPTPTQTPTTPPPAVDPTPTTPPASPTTPVDPVTPSAAPGKKPTQKMIIGIVALVVILAIIVYMV
ncbi:hypothetical protein H0X09_00285 [Candidatus Saccharibacteria bacterium]|nr:hypothetical protein [Candidatus Saccharibacteria bacterium]